MSKKRILVPSILLIVFLVIFSSSYALFRKEMIVGGVNVKVGELSYNMETGFANNRIILEANSSVIINVKITSENPIDTKYELFYKIENDATTNIVEGGYLEESLNTPQEVAKSNEIKEIKLVFNNTGNETVTIELILKSSLLSDHIIKEEKEISLNKIILQKYWRYDYIGSFQEFTVPKTGTYKVELWGAGGDNYTKGAYTSGEINLEQNEKLQVVVGGQGKEETPTIGGYNGGGASIIFNERQGRPGSGATDVRLTGTVWNDFNSLKSRIMVAGGSCGRGVDNEFGNAGGLEGYGSWGTDMPSYPQYRSYGGTQTAGGQAPKIFITSVDTAPAALPGSFGIGGDASRAISTGAGSGGGGGYYGGSGGTGAAMGGWGGGGGSSFISGHAGCDSITETSTVTNIIHTGLPNHYSGKVFTNTKMVDGRGYNWTTEVGEQINMPTHDLTSTMIGNVGNGYARITYLK